MTAAWLSLDIIKWTVATLAVPVTLGFLSYQYDKASSARQAAEARFRLYTEILSRREDTDTALRKAILDKALGSMKGAQENFGDRLTALELLAVNFHDSLNLRPLFAETERSIANSRHSTERKNALRRRLYDILGDIKARQLRVLEVVGDKRDRTINLAELQRGSSVLLDEKLAFTDPDTLTPGQMSRRHFKLDVSQWDAQAQRLFFVLTYEGARTEWGFWVDLLQFPMMDFVRVSRSERFAIVLLWIHEAKAVEATLVYFPSVFGVKDRPFMDEIISDLRHYAK